MLFSIKIHFALHCTKVILGRMQLGIKMNFFELYKIISKKKHFYYPQLYYYFLLNFFCKNT